MLDGSIALFLQVCSAVLDSLIELSGILRDTVLHLVLDVECSYDVVVFG